MIELLVYNAKLLRAGPYFSYYICLALRQIGAGNELYIRFQLWRRFLDAGFHTFTEGGIEVRSDCHAWSAHPLFHMRILMTVAILVLLQGCRRDAAPHLPAQPGLQTSAITLDTFMEAAHNGDAETVARGLKAGMDSNTTIVEGRTPLMLAAFNGRTVIVEALLKAGAKASSADVFGRTALMYAASGPNADTVRILLRSGTEVNAVDKEEQWTALMFAAAEGQTEVVRLLLDAGADRTLKDKDGDTAENFAIKSNHKDVITLLQAPKAE